MLTINTKLFLKKISLQQGFMEVRHFITKDIIAKKFYQREGAVIQEDSVGFENMVTVAPETEGDSPFSNSDDDDDFFSSFEDDEDF